MPPVKTLPDGKICDYVDQKIRSDTPEEYVRQNIERRLVLELSYPTEQIAVEFPIKIGSQKVRVDLAIFPEGQEHIQDNISVIIECKKEATEPTNRKEGVDQLKSYLSACPNAEWGMWTNGRNKAVFRKAIAEGRLEWTEPNDIPSKDGDIEELDRPKREHLKNATDDNLLFSFKICHNHIYVTDGMQKQPAFFELLKVIFCKIHDERNVPHALNFYATAKEKVSSDGRLTIKLRMGKIFDAVKKRYPKIFDPNDEIKLDPRSLSYIVGELQRYSFLDTSIDVKGKAYEELVGANLRGDRGEFFTPRNVQSMTIKMLDIKEGERILDPACGTGGFLVIAMKAVIDHLTEACGADLTESVKRALTDKIHDLAAKCFFGFDINPDLVKATKMNMVMNNDGAGNILRADSLLHPHQWPAEFKSKLVKALDIEADSLRGPELLGHFDVISTNPPFGAKLPIKDQETLSQFQLGHVWEEGQGGNLHPTIKLQSSVPPEILFIERCWQFLKPGGRMGIVLPDSILGNPNLRYVREWMLRHCRVVASIDLHPDTFQPRNGTQTSVLVLQRKTEEEMNRELQQGQLSDYGIFMAQIEAIGHDKRGNTLYRRNEDGEIIFVPGAPEKTSQIIRAADGTPAVKHIRQTRIRDDDTPDVAEEFLGWKKTAVLGW